MENLQSSEMQVATLEMLADLLHVRPSKLGDLFIKEQNPLPIPQNMQYDGQFIFNGSYLQELKVWLWHEKEIGINRQSRGIDLDIIEQELEDEEKRVSRSEADVEHPSDYYLG